MNPKSTWNWLILALGLFAFIFFFERHLRPPEPMPAKVFQNFLPAETTSIQIHPANQLEIRTDLTNGAWLLTKPIVYPAQPIAVEGLLDALEKLTPATIITVRELREHPNYDHEYGFDSPQYSLTIEKKEGAERILIGSRTAPGDQVFLQIVGTEGVFVVDADILKFLPRSADDWRDTALVDLHNTVFNRITLDSGGLTIGLQYNGTNKTWMMTQPLQARVDNDKLAERLQMLQTLRVTRFVSDSPKADLETYGLQPPELQLSLGYGTNTVAVLQFGKLTTNDPPQLYARRVGVDSVVAVTAQPVAPWRVRVEELRDHRFVTFAEELGRIEFDGENSFALQRSSSNTWKFAAETFPVDTALVNELVTALGAIQINQFKDAVTDPELQEYGLAKPSRTITLRAARPNGGYSTNSGLQLSFGSEQDTNVFARRSDENAVYSISLGDYQQFPTEAWQLRDRRVWNFSENDVTRLTIRQGGKTRELIRGGTNSWSFAPGSQGMINEFAVEEAVHRFGELQATAWVARGDESRSQFGIGTNSLSLTFDLKNGDKQTVEFSDVSPNHYTFAASVIGGLTWIYEFPFALHQLVNSYLAIPAEKP